MKIGVIFNDLIFCLIFWWFIGSKYSSSQLSSDLLQLPSIHHFLPHLLSTVDSLKPAFRLSKSTRNSYTIVFGVPTVKRDVESYLVSTLHNLIDNLSVDERPEACIVVFIAEVFKNLFWSTEWIVLCFTDIWLENDWNHEFLNLLLTLIISLFSKTDMDYVLKTANELEAQFGEHIDSGLLEIISPPASYYPNMTTLRQTLGDPIERVRWRSKQNLDFAYLMMYSQPKATYYVQLEDDILTKPSYLTKMKRFAVKASLQKKEWLILDFCVLGFIGDYHLIELLSHL